MSNDTGRYEEFWNRALNFSNMGVQGLKPDEVDLDEEVVFYTSPSQKYAMQCMGNIKNKKILEIGCGLGINAIILARDGAYVTATDIAEKRVEWIKELVAKTGLEGRIRVAHVCRASPIWFEFL